MSKHGPPAIFLMGPTASGKTGMAVELAQRWPVELISVDSALVYRGMDIGTAKPDTATLALAPHHLIDIIDPTDAYSAARFRTDALKLVEDIHSRGRIPLLVGGTMLYFNALQHGINLLPESNPVIRSGIRAEANRDGWPALHFKLTEIDPDTAERLKPNDSQRIERALEIYRITGRRMSDLLEEQREAGIPYPLIKIALLPSDRSVLHQKIAVRFEEMLSQGLVDELNGLRARHPGLTPELPSMRCVGYRQAWQFIEGEIDKLALRDKGIAATRQLAKRQITWLRGMPDTIRIDCLSKQEIDSINIQIKQYI